MYGGFVADILWSGFIYLLSTVLSSAASLVSPPSTFPIKTICLIQQTILVPTVTTLDKI
jgi:hypothetical protein